MILRLKEYTKFIYGRYIQALYASAKPLVQRTTSENLVLSSFAVTGQTILFFNQPQDDQSFAEWSTNPEIPHRYQLKINHCLSLLIDSSFWCLFATSLDAEDFPEKPLFFVDLDGFRIEETPQDMDGLTRQFFTTCDLLHRKCPYNTRLREGLIRLINAYIEAKELTLYARELSTLDRITYLKKLTIH